MTIPWGWVFKFLAPIAAVAALYFWAHDAGWNDRNADVPGLIKTAVDAAVETERTACAADIKLTGGIAHDLQKKLEATGALYANAVGRLYDANHRRSESAPVPAAAGGDNGAAGGGRLYYADPSGALPALQRASIATKQAEQLIGCQAFITGERK